MATSIRLGWRRGLIDLYCFALYNNALTELRASENEHVDQGNLGPRLAGFRLGGIRFNLRAIPVGSFVRLDGARLKEKSVRAQLFVHLSGIIFNMVAGFLTYGTVFGWLNLLVAAGNILPLYQHDGWKCGVVIMRAWLRRDSQPAERVFTFSGGFVSLLIAWLVMRMF